MSAELAHNDPFVDDAALKRMTGYAWKSLQIGWLRAEGIPFRVSATGHPVVLWSAIDGRPAVPEPKAAPAWTPRVISSKKA